MQVNYRKLFELIKAKGMTQKNFKTEIEIGGTTFKKLLNNDSITTKTICKICDYFHCMPCDIMEFIPEPTEPENPEIAQTEKQIAELQEKLQRLKGEEKP